MIFHLVVRVRVEPGGKEAVSFFENLAGLQRDKRDGLLQMFVLLDAASTYPAVPVVGKILITLGSFVGRNVFGYKASYEEYSKQ